MELYSQILDHGGPALAIILRHVRDKPEQGFLFHCTAGKDRTGIIASILLKVLYPRCFSASLEPYIHSPFSSPGWTTRSSLMIIH